MFNPCPSERMLSPVCVRTPQRSANRQGGPGERKPVIHHEQAEQKANNTAVCVGIQVANWLSPGQNWTKTTKKFLKAKPTRRNIYLNGFMKTHRRISCLHMNDFDFYEWQLSLFHGNLDLLTDQVPYFQGLLWCPEHTYSRKIAKDEQITHTKDLKIAPKHRKRYPNLLRKMHIKIAMKYHFSLCRLGNIA